MAHITGGGIAGNLSRIIPEGLCAKINLAALKIPPVFHYIRRAGNIEESEMLSTFNCGAGLILVAAREWKEEAVKLVRQYYDCYEIGVITQGEEKVSFKNHIIWM